MNLSITTLIYFVIIIGVLAFLVSAVTQLTKGIGFLAKIPTKLQVLVLSIILSVMAYLAYASYTNTTILWYHIVGAIILGVIVALIASEGWTYTLALLKRFISSDLITDITDSVIDIMGKDGSK